MSKKTVEERKRDNYHLKIIFSVLIMVISMLAELYIMILMKGDPVFLAIFGLLFLIFSYVLVNSILQIQYLQTRIDKEDHEGLMKSEKATYLIVKKSFDEIFRRLDNLEKGMYLPTEELITAQKAIAKINISRSKENTDALMNSNDKLLEKMMEFGEALNNQKSDGGQNQNQNQNVEQRLQDVAMKQQELNSALSEMQLNLKNEILQAVNTIAASQPQPQVMAQPIQPAMDIPAMEEPIFENPLIPEEPMLDENPLMPEMLEEPILDENPLMPDENPLMSAEEPILDENPLMPEMPEEPMLDENPLMPEMPEEPMLDENPLMAEIPEEPILDENPLMAEIPEEPAVEEAAAPAPDLSDPNKMMSPDDIAALLANANAVEEAEEMIAQEEPENDEEIPIPDMSDPNKMMSPDDIAALIANL